MFGVEWQYVPVTSGSMVKGQPKIKDVTLEEYLTFLDLDSFDWEGVPVPIPLFRIDDKNLVDEWPQ